MVRCLMGERGERGEIEDGGKRETFFWMKIFIFWLLAIVKFVTTFNSEFSAKFRLKFGRICRNDFLSSRIFVASFGLNT